MSLTLSQAEYDNVVSGIANHQMRLGAIIVAMRRQADPDAWKREEELMILQNLIAALKNYDVDKDWLTDDDVNYYFELATNVVEYC